MPTEDPAAGGPAEAGGAAYGIDGPIVGLEAPEEVCPPADPLLQAEYPGARFIAAAPDNYLARAGCGPRTIERIVIHITDGHRGIGGPISHFQDPKAQVSAHYIIGQDGAVVQMVRHDDVAWHAHKANAGSIGIEHVARSPKELSPDDPGLPVTAAQYRSSAQLVRWLCEQHNLPLDRDHVQGHAEADPETTHADCPNRIWNWRSYMALLTGAR